MRVTIDREQCIACGACYLECPGVFEENGDDSWSQITAPYRVDGNIGVGEVPNDLEACARAGADVCPVAIIHAGSMPAGKENPMIVRIWHGWTTPANADRYEALLKEEIFVGIRERSIKGFHGIELLRRIAGEETEFITIMRFDSLQAVREFAGEDYDVAVVPETARAVLSHFDARSQHYQLRIES